MSPKPNAGPNCCGSVGATMIGHFANRLQVEAAKAGGSLSIVQIQALAKHFVQAEQSRFKGYYQRAYDECTMAREAQLLETARRQPFERILMRRFAHLFPARTGDDGGSGILSRRIIPGFILAVGKMVGPTLLATCQAVGEAVIARHAQPGGGCDWEAVHADLDARGAAEEALMSMAATFTVFERRRAWFLDMVNANLAPVRRGASDEAFRLGESGFSAMMRALYSDLAASVKADPGAAMERFGPEPVEALRQFVLRLDRS